MQQTAFAPGRVELLGNHTDYNEGYVLSAAIDRGITVSGKPTGSGAIRLRSADFGVEGGADLAKLDRDLVEPWMRYPLGVFEIFRGAGLPISGADLVIEGTLPAGAGLSSSAALEVATGRLLEKLFGFSLEPIELARLCRQAENRFVGVNCGLLDQVSSVFGKAGHVIFLDCRAESVETVPMLEGVSLLIAECGVAHQLSGGEYNERREQCFDAARILNAPALRDVGRAQLEGGRSQMPDLTWRRALHVVGENERVLKGIAALRSGDVKAFGQLMWESHESSRVNFENSTPELDQLVALAREIPGIYGARLTGGGFGGATVNLVETTRADAIAEALATAYERQTGHRTAILQCALSDGAR